MDKVGLLTTFQNVTLQSLPWIKVSNSSMFLYQAFLEKQIIEICGQNKIKIYKDNNTKKSLITFEPIIIDTLDHLGKNGQPCPIKMA